ncbi:MAG: PAS domain S-box protein, partial [Proteobacteria bacterium]|nr:PAS domain S-box protein [Pseudomonadota bacterium]
YRVTCKDGTVRTIVISGAVLGDDFLAVFFDITERKLADEELRRTNRALRTLSQCSQILVRAREEKEVLQDFCRIITGDGGYRMAWVGFAEHDEAKSVRPVAQMGFEEGYLAAANITWADTARGKGPTGTAIQTGRTVTALDLLTNPDYTPWRDEATKRGYASSIAIPLKSDGQVLGALNIYASEIDAFNEVEVELLEKVAQTLAYGIIALRAEKNRTQAEEALQRSEDQFRAAFENAPEGMALLDLKRRFLKVNPRLCEMLGYSEQELLGNSFNRFTHPDDRQGGRDRWREFLAGDLSVKRAEKRYIHKNGQVVWVVVSNSAISNSQGEVKYILAHIYDITDRKQAEEKLAQTARQWQTTFDSANDAIWIFDKQQRVLRANKTAEMMFHRSQEEMVGRHCWEIVHGTTEPIPECPLKRAKVSLHRETMELRIGDSWFAVVVDPILDENGQYAGAVHIVSDITERRRLESQLHQSQKMEAVGTLAGGIAHDFNNILAAIMGYTEIGLAEAEEGKSNRAELQGVLQAATRAKKLVQQILTFSRRAEHSLKPIDINEAVVSAGNLLKQTLPRMIEIQMDLSVELPPAMGNPYQIEQILMNLGTNARDAMPDGGTLTIATSQRRVKGVACLACAQPIDGDYVIITVSDTGVGMTEEELARVFEPFYTTKEVGKGTGLGLSTIFGIVGSHGGHITCASEPGMGTTFSIYLPPVAQAGEQPKRAATKSAAGGNETILVVDDEQSILDIAARQLTKSGYKTLTAISGEKALEVYKDRADEIALVILDLSMPGMGGHKCLRELRSLAPELKVIVATGYSRDGDLNKSASSVATALLSKPFSKNELLKTVRKVLDA